MDAGSIVKIVDAAIHKHTPPNFGTEILIDPQSVREDSTGRWYIHVYPSRELHGVYSFYDILAQAESELDEQGIRIAFVPAKPVTH